MNESESNNCEYTVFAGGDSRFFSSVAFPLTAALEEELRGDDSVKKTKKLPDFLHVDSRPQADASVIIGGVVGIFMFFTSWLGKKVLDEIYEAKFRPAIKRALGEVDNNMSKEKKRSLTMLQVGVSYNDKRVFILIGIVGYTFSEILASEHMLASVHRNAVEWIENNSFAEPILLYIINHGNVNVEPIRFDSLIHADRYIRTIEFEC